MVIVQSQQTEISEGPRQITIDNVQHYSHHARELTRSQLHKAMEFVRNGCVKYAGLNTFICGPIEGYNSRTYTIERSSEYQNTHRCNCQCWEGKHRRGEILAGGANCSHVLALYLLFRMKHNFDGFEDIHGDISRIGGDNH